MRNLPFIIEYNYNHLFIIFSIFPLINFMANDALWAELGLADSPSLLMALIR